MGAREVIAEALHKHFESHVEFDDTALAWRDERFAEADTILAALTADFTERREELNRVACDRYCATGVDGQEVIIPSMAAALDAVFSEWVNQ